MGQPNSGYTLSDPVFAIPSAMVAFVMGERSAGRSLRLPRPSIRAIVQTVACAAAGAAIGIGAFFVLLEGSRGERNGVWWTHLGGQENRMDLDALALHAVYQMKAEKALYWTAFTDSQGEPLDRRRHYRILSSALPARFWSLTLYDAEDRLLPNHWERYSVSSLDVSTNPDGSFAVDVSPAFIPGNTNWISSGAASRDERRLLLQLRLYDIDLTARRNPMTLALPKIVRVAD